MGRGFPAAILLHKVLIGFKNTVKAILLNLYGTFSLLRIPHQLFPPHFCMFKAQFLGLNHFFSVPNLLYFQRTEKVGSAKRSATAASDGSLIFQSFSLAVSS